MNGPIKGKDVFIPLDYLIGGPEMAGQGWRMLVECLSVGRCITLPSGASGSGRYATGLSGGFTRIRRQFNLPVADMEGVQEPLARIAGMSYIAQSAVMQTANMIDNGEKPAVPSAILKSQLTEYQRDILTDAMDVHGGKTVTLGPRNYLGLSFAGSAVSITVEGANIMTRSLMIFGQGAIRCHPYVLDELAAKDADDQDAFDEAFFGHAGLVFGNAARAFTQALGIGRGDVPFDNAAAPYARAVNRFSAAFGLASDAAMGTLGSDLKLRELLSARLGDVLSNLYLTSMVLKNWHEGQAVEGERDLMAYSCEFPAQPRGKGTGRAAAQPPEPDGCGGAACHHHAPWQALARALGQADPVDCPCHQHRLRTAGQDHQQHLEPAGEEGRALQCPGALQPAAGRLPARGQALQDAG